MRLTTALSAVLLLSLVACASAPRRPTSSANAGQKSLFDRCTEAQQAGNPPPATCPATPDPGRQQTRSQPSLPDRSQFPAGLGNGNLPSAGTATGGIFR